MDEQLIWIWLSKLKHLSYECFIKLLDKYESIFNIWSLSLKNKIDKNILAEALLKELYSINLKTGLEQELNYLKNNDIKLVNCFCNEYPNKLNYIKNRPIVLYVKGDMQIINYESVRNSWL